MRHLRRKLTLRAHGQQVVFVKTKQERIEHVWMKAFLWALYLPGYPDLSVELSVGDRFKPDVVSFDERRGRPVFWGEAGSVGSDKIASLLDRYPDVHFAICKWDAALAPYVEIVEDAVGSTERSAAVDLLRIPDGADRRFIDDRGHIDLSFDDVTWTRIGDARSLGG
jgi:hypothetical protein